MEAFTIATTPLLHFGTGKISALPGIVKSFGSSILLVTGRQSFFSSEHGQNLLEQLNALSLTVHHYSVNHEPSPIVVDTAVLKFSPHAPDIVVAIGGGSVLDAGKAISAMLPLNESVKDYLEGFGAKKTHPGTKVPFLAVPTTSGTGSEATKNAVLSDVGKYGYKKSLRHNNFVPNIAIVDPALAIGCPPVVTATSGMDAFTQLLESYLSTAGNPITDALAYEGLTLISTSLIKAYQDGSNMDARTGMALSSYISGITLANAGLGLVHGFASSIGGFYNIPHGVICSTLMAASNKIAVRKLRQRGDPGRALMRYGRIGKIFAGLEGKSNEYYTDFLIWLMERWAVEMDIPALSMYGISSSDFEKIVNATDNKYNPVALDKDELIEVLSIAH